VEQVDGLTSRDARRTSATWPAGSPTWSAPAGRSADRVGRTRPTGPHHRDPLLRQRPALRTGRRHRRADLAWSSGAVEGREPHQNAQTTDVRPRQTPTYSADACSSPTVRPPTITETVPEPNPLTVDNVPGRRGRVCAGERTPWARSEVARPARGGGRRDEVNVLAWPSTGTAPQPPSATTCCRRRVRPLTARPTCGDAIRRQMQG
jgi:hypothetical protein